MLVRAPGKYRLTLVVPIRLQAAGLVASSQFIDEMLEMGRHTRIWAEDLLETFAHSVAN
jgi:hypothetical protein